MLQTSARIMILLIQVIVLICFSEYAAGNTNVEFEIGNVYQKLEAAKEMIESAKERLPRDMRSALPTDCEDILKTGKYMSGVYQVWPTNRIISGSISVYCDMGTDGGGWTVIQRRGNFSRSKYYFYQDWQCYKKGFGHLTEDFWLGNDYIYALSNEKLYSIRFDLRDFDGEERYALYDTFWIDDENSKYALHVAGYTGNAGDAFSYHDGCKFSTKDRDNDNASENCAQVLEGAWWFNKCIHSHLNGKYPESKVEEKSCCIRWATWKSRTEPLATSEMKIRKNRIR